MDNGTAGSNGERDRLRDALGNLGDMGGVTTPIEGMLAASRDFRVEALNHFLSAASEMVLATKAMTDAAERAVEFGRAWIEGMEAREPAPSAESATTPGPAPTPGAPPAPEPGAASGSNGSTASETVSN